MIKARELMIGNWVEYNGEIWQVDHGNIYDLGQSQEADKEMPGYAPVWNGVPITEDWLIKLGADKYDYGKNEDLIDYKFYLGKCIILLRFIKSKNMYYVRHLSTKFKYIHHLQNYVFVTTGEELNVKE